MKKKVLKQNWKENIDYNTSSKKFEVASKGYKELDTHYFTMEMAKHVSLTENTIRGKLVKDYFIKIEKALRNYEQWTMIREPQKLGYDQLSKAVDQNYRLTHEGKETPNYIYSNEADMINIALLGDSAKNINKILDTEDKVIRDPLTLEINKTLSELQTMDIALIMAGLDYNTRKATIENICNTKYINISLKVKELRKIS